MSINIKAIINSIENEVRKFEDKLPTEIEEVAVWGDKYVSEAEAILTSGQALDFTTLVPETEPLRETVVAVLSELEVGLKALEVAFATPTPTSISYRKLSLLGANANLIMAKVSGISLANAVTSAQLVREGGKVVA